MRIGKWTIRFVRWAIVFERAVDGWIGIDWGQDYDGFANPIVDVFKHSSAAAGALYDKPLTWDNLAKYYSHEEVERWRKELGDHLGGV